MKASDNSFPKELDGAKVLYYTDKANYGEVRYPDGTISDYIFYLAICVYPKDQFYYVFCCDENYEVVSDAVWDSVEECKRITDTLYPSVKWIDYSQDNALD